MDTLICSDKKDAKKYIDNIGCEYIEEWEFLENGEVKLILKDGWIEKKGLENDNL